MSTIGTRGKYAEAKVKARLEELAVANADFTYMRHPDARGGSMKVAPADFQYMQGGEFNLLEVKEVEHVARLPYANFKPDQIGRMKTWELAGAWCWVLIYFTPLKKWRKLPLSYFLTKEEAGSWNMKDVPLLDLKEALYAV